MPTFSMYHGDSLAILRSLPTASVDAVITDPPYSSGGTTTAERTNRTPRQKYQQSGTLKTYPTFEGEVRDQRSFTYWCTLWLAECYRIATTGAPICVFIDWRQLPAMTDAVQAAGWAWRGILPWHKPSARCQLGRFTNQCEYVVWGSKGAMPARAEVGTIPGLVSASVIASQKFHMTGKPIPVMEHLVRICSPNSTVLDPFAGSGSTGVAALQRGHSFIGIEQSADYVEIARTRLADALGQATQPPTE